MMFWIVISLSALIAGGWIAVPLLRSASTAPTGEDGALSIYRDQLKELDRDRTAGLISAAEADAASQEIERRALHLSRQRQGALTAPGRAPAAAFALTLAAAIFGVALYAALGSPEASDQPLAMRAQDILQQKAEAGDLRSSIQLLAQKAEQEPENLDSWLLLAQSYGVVGEDDLSRDAYARAAALAPDRPDIQSSYAEAIVSANDDTVSAEAIGIFARLVRDHNDPRARYYLALAKAQDQDYQGALVGWVRLLENSDPEAPWVPLVRRDIVGVVRLIGMDLRQILPDASQDEILAARGGDSADAGGDAIPPRLTPTPKSYEDWIEQARAQMAKDDPEAARKTLERARSMFAEAPFVLSRIDAAAQEMGMATPGSDTFDPEVVAAITGMEEGERNQMIADMVSGLSARLQSEPKDVEGWIMLVRSYATLGRMNEAEQAYQNAADIFETDADALALLRGNTEQLLDR